MHDNPHQAPAVHLDRMPRLKEMFQYLQRGGHVSSETFGLYHEMQDHEVAYEALFAALGYTLESDRRGFYYLVPEDTQLILNATTQKMALLIFVLVDVLADSGRDPLQAMLKDELSLQIVSEQMFDNHTALLMQGGFESAEAVEKYFSTTFCRLGFAAVDGEQLRFLAPVHRFLDVCAELGREEWREDIDETGTRE